MYCLEQAFSVATYCHFSSPITVAILLCDVSSGTITTPTLSEPYTVFLTRRLSFQILFVRSDHTQLSLQLLINFQLIQCSNNPKLLHVSTLLTLRSLPASMGLRQI